MNEAIQSLVETTLASIKDRSVSGRTGLKMINCQVCRLRHREPMCEEKVVVKVFPSRHPKKVRFNPHSKHGKHGTRHEKPEKKLVLPVAGSANGPE